MHRQILNDFRPNPDRNHGVTLVGNETATILDWTVSENIPFLNCRLAPYLRRRAELYEET